MKREDSMLFAMRIVLAMFLIYLGYNIIMKKEMPIFIGISLIIMAICVVIGGILVIYKIETEKEEKCNL